MTMRRALLACGLLALPATLGGCVAAVAAIPVLAGGGVAVGGPGEPKEPEAPIDTGATLPPPPFARETPLPQPADEAPNIAPAPLDESPAGLGTGIADTATGAATDPEDASAGLAPAATAPATAATSAAADVAPAADPYQAFSSHALAQARLDPVDDPRASAILATPGSLDPVMSDCAIRPPAVLIDLDPAGGTLDLDRPVASNPGLADALGALRVRDVAVFWISGASAAEAGKLRERLLISGLDPWGRDGLLLMRRADDRKQIRRRELSEMHCVVAIAGDSKSDFDELFDYLKNPAAAEGLDALIGEGWFLTPTPFASEED